MNKKIWLDKLFYDIGKQQYDFKICGLKKVDDKIIPSRWYKFSELIFPLEPWEDYKISFINQRQTLPIEVVLDLEEKEKLSIILQELKKMNLIFYVFFTGSRGYHIHIFFSKEISDEDRLNIINFFGADPQINSTHMIALEYAPHWKSGKIKEEINYD